MENAENETLTILNLKGSGTEKKINQTQWKRVACLQTQVTQDVHKMYTPTFFKCC